MIVLSLVTYLVVNSPALHWLLTFYATSLPLPTLTSTSTRTLWMLEAQLSHQRSHGDVVAAAADDAAILTAPRRATDDVY